MPSVTVSRKKLTGLKTREVKVHVSNRQHVVPVNSLEHTLLKGWAGKYDPDNVVAEVTISDQNTFTQYMFPQGNFIETQRLENDKESVMNGSIREMAIERQRS